jgi:hypothetical protein
VGGARIFRRDIGPLLPGTEHCRRPMRAAAAAAAAGAAISAAGYVE